MAAAVDAPDGAPARRAGGRGVVALGSVPAWRPRSVRGARGGTRPVSAGIPGRERRTPGDARAVARRERPAVGSRGPGRLARTLDLPVRGMEFRARAGPDRVRDPGAERVHGARGLQRFLIPPRGR